jgi:sugar/nucleoside kinase (ribokinase family)
MNNLRMVIMMYDAVAIGELLIDFIAKGNTENGYPILHANPGGAPGNFLSVLAKYGLKTGFIGKVGNDAFGSLLLDTLAKSGIDTSGILMDDSVFTTLAFVTLNGDGDRNFSFARKPGADTMLRHNELKNSMMRETKVFHFGTLSMTDEPAREATKQAVITAKNTGALITFDPNYRAPLWKSKELAAEQMLWGVKQADVVKIGSDELGLLFDDDYPAAASRLVKDFGVKLVLVTMGKEGCYFVNQNACGAVPTFQEVKTIDTTGAGDIFGGAAVYKMLTTKTNPEDLTKKQLVEIVTFANAAASLSTTRNGGIPSIPEKAEVEHFLQAHQN